MSTENKSRSLTCSDTSRFRIGPRTVSVDVSDLLTDPPAVRLHINPNTGAVELPPAPDGTPQLPVRLFPHEVVYLVNRINGSRETEDQIAVSAGIKRLAKHTACWGLVSKWRKA